MNKLCLTFLTLALGAPALANARDDKTPPLVDSTATKTSVAASASTSATAKITISDQDALGDDILAVINLPIAAADAREAGIAEVELKEALDVTRESGLSAGDATEVVAEEADQTRTRGAKKGFGRWVKMQVAAGLRGKKLTAKIKERKQDTAELDEKQQEDLRVKLEKQRELNTQWRAKLLEKRGELVAKGKARVILHKERNDKLKAKIDAGQEKKAENGDAIEGRLRDLDARIAAATGDDKKALEAEKERLQKAEKHNDKASDKLDKAESRADKRDERLDKVGDKLDKVGDKLDKLKDKRDGRTEGKGSGEAKSGVSTPANPPQ